MDCPTREDYEAATAAADLRAMHRHIIAARLGIEWRGDDDTRLIG